MLYIKMVSYDFKAIQHMRTLAKNSTRLKEVSYRAHSRKIGAVIRSPHVNSRSRERLITGRCEIVFALYPLRENFFCNAKGAKAPAIKEVSYVPPVKISYKKFDNKKVPSKAPAIKEVPYVPFVRVSYKKFDNKKVPSKALATKEVSYVAPVKVSYKKFDNKKAPSKRAKRMVRPQKYMRYILQRFLKRKLVHSVRSTVYFKVGG